MKISDDLAKSLRRAIDGVTQPDAGLLCLDVLPALQRLGASGHRFEIDLTASKTVGVPVIVVHAGLSPCTALTRRQREVARALAAGQSNMQIASDLSISIATVKDHVHAVLSRLGLKRRSEVAALAREIQF